MNTATTNQPAHDFLLSLKSHASHPCLVVNLTTRGAAILQPKANPLPIENFGLLIATPSDDHAETLVTAGLRWVDNDYSSRYRKLGVEFSEMDAGVVNNIEQCIAWMLADDERRIACSVISA